MTKHRKHKTNKRSQRRRQRGGWWPFGANADSTAEVSNYTTKASEEANKLGAQASAYATEATTGLTSWFNSAKETVTGATDTAPTVTSQYNPSDTQVTPTVRPINASPSGAPAIEATGGKRHKKSFKGGKGGLGLAYYATPVSGLKVVEPNEWLLYNNMANLKGGSRRRKCKTRRCKCKTRKRKCKTRRRK